MKKIPAASFSTSRFCLSDSINGVDPALAERIAGRMRTPKQVNTMDPRALIAMEAALSLNPTFPCPPERRGIVLAQPHLDGAYPALAEAFAARENGGDFRPVARRFPPLWLTWHLPNMAAAHLASQFDCRGPVHSLPSGWHGTSDSREVVRDCLDGGEADAVLEVTIEFESEKESDDTAQLVACACLITGSDLS